MADYHLVLRPLASDVPAEVRLGRALKCLLRVYALRAVSVREQSEKPPAAQAAFSAGAVPHSGHLTGVPRRS